MQIQTPIRFALIALAGIGLSAAQAAGSQAPTDVGRQILRSTGITLDQIRDLEGDPLVVELDVRDSSRQAGFAGLVRIEGNGENLFAEDNAAWSALLDSPRRVGDFEPAGPESLNTLELPSDEFELLEECRLASCRFKLDETGIQTAQSVDWSQPGAREQFLTRFRALLDDKVSSYQSDGLDGLITYADKEQPFPVASGVLKLEEEVEPLLSLYPGLDRYLGGYPNAGANAVSDRFLWTMADIGFRPTLTVDHVVVSGESADRGLPSAMALRTIYANHYLAGRLQLAGVIDGPTVFGVPGRFVLTVDQILFDDELGRIKRSLLGRGLKSKVADRLTGVRIEASEPG